MTAEAESIDAFHRGAFHVIQPKGRGHRAGMDAMMLACLVDSAGPVRLADLGAGCGAAGMAVVARLVRQGVEAEGLLVEYEPDMVDFAQRSLALPGNEALKDRLSVLRADVTLTGKARRAAGLADDHFDHVIMNPPFNDSRDRRTPDALKSRAHAATETLFEDWIRTAGAILKPGGQLSLIARPDSLGEIMAACKGRFGGLEVTPLVPREGDPAIRILVTGIKGSRARLALRSQLTMHAPEAHPFVGQVDDLNNGRSAYPRLRVQGRQSG